MAESALTSSVKKNLPSSQISQLKKEDNVNNQFIFYLDLPDSQALKQVLTLNPDILVGQAMEKAIEVFDKQLTKENKGLETLMAFYAPRLAKKNGKAKIDMPCIQLGQKIGNIKIKAISIQIKNQNALKIKSLNYSKASTKESIKVEIGKGKPAQQLPQQDQIVQKQKRSDCFLSFC